MVNSDDQKIVHFLTQVTVQLAFDKLSQSQDLVVDLYIHLAEEFVPFVFATLLEL